jgi:type I restriction enzyme S subunit
MSFPRYPAYKESGVEWLGRVPEHWRVDRLKASILSCRNGIWGDEAQDDENDIPCVRVADFDRQKLHVRLQQPTIRNVTEKERAHRLLKRGDLLLEKSGGGENQPVGCVVLYDDDQPAVCSNFVAKVEMAPSMDSSYWRYVHAAAYAVRLTIGSINQTSGIQNLDQDRYFNERAAFPPEQEQTAIGEFLDRETAKIDALVAEQEQLITLLKEKRQAVISHAVTKGLDPSVPMKDSGVEWLGVVPKHWRVMPIRLAARLESGHTPSRSRPDWWVDCNIPWFSLADVWQIREAGRDVIYETKELVSELGLANSSARLLPKGTVMLSRTASVGFAAIMGVDMATTQDFANWVCGDELLPEFLLAVFKAMKPEFQRLMMGSTHNTIYMPDIQAFRFALPSLDDQRAVVTHLSERLQAMDKLIDEAVLSIELLRERRSALISAAVTGQIDVRGLAPAQEQAA